MFGSRARFGCCRSTGDALLGCAVRNGHLLIRPSTCATPSIRPSTSARSLPATPQADVALSRPPLKPQAQALGAPGNIRPALVRHTIFTADGNPVIYRVNTLPLAVVSLSLAGGSSQTCHLELLPIFSDKMRAAANTMLPQSGQPLPNATCSAVCHPLSPVLVIGNRFSSIALPSCTRDLPGCLHVLK
jgi:hypothetical protein